VASGQASFGEFVDTSDLTMMHSVVDMFGINSLTREVLTSTAGAIAGMVEARAAMQYADQKPRIAITVLGNTTPAGMTIKRLLVERGYEVVGFHANGTGGVAAETLIAEGYFDAVMDLTTHEIVDRQYGGKHAAISDNRLVEAGKAGIPQLVVPACIDYLVLGDPDSLPPQFRGRPYVIHNPQITLVRATQDEMAHVAEIMAARLNKAKGPTAVAIPLGGPSMHNVEGHVFFDPQADRACRDVFKEKLRSDIPLHEVDAHVNDPVFAERGAAAGVESRRELTGNHAT